MGTAEFAVPSLQESVAHHEVLAVVTQPAKRGDRGRPAPRPVADAAVALGLRVLTPAKLRDPAAVDELLAIGADAIVVAAYGQILPPALLDGPPHGAVNVHASLLPRWRGAAPVAHAILAGDTETGVCIMRMDAGLDTGPVYASARVRIDEDATAPRLTASLAGLGSQLLIDVLATLGSGAAIATPQPDAGVTYAPRLRREDGRLRWEDTGAQEIDRRVRALQPWPGVTMPLAGLEVRIVDGVCAAEAEVGAAAPGTVVRVDGERALVAACQGGYWVHHLRPPGGRDMSAAAYLRGRRVSAPA